MSDLNINVKYCRDRQARLVAEMRRRNLDLVVVTQPEHVQWLAGPRFLWFFQPSAALSIDGKLTLVAPNEPPEVAAADEVVTYEAQKCSTLRNDQRQASAEALLQVLDIRRAKRLGVEFASFGPHYGPLNQGQLVDIEPSLYYMRRRKDPDELARLRHAIAGTGRMYERAREIMRPGISELEMFCELQAAAVTACGETLVGTGNDYQCGSPGGPPRNGRQAKSGELYILDLGPSFRGYFADNCRTIAVDKATDRQKEAWSFVMKAFSHVQANVRPGVSCRKLYEDVHRIVNQSPTGQFNHHLGHGIGLFPHEAPHLNPRWDDAFEVGDVFTVEPGLYAAELQAGMRLENNYLVTETGVELLSDFPMTLE